VSRKRTKRRHAQREAIWRAQDKICFLCGEKMYPVSVKNPVLGWSIDHVRPKSAGNARTRNSLISHTRCNSAKGDREPRPCELLFLEAVNAKLSIWEDA
jgi:5-methylcytosine-specific restriction endonuclease McrA